MSAARRSPEWRKARGAIQRRARELGLDEDARRALQRRETGKESCADMSVAELRRVAAAMNGRAGRRAEHDGKRAAHDGARAAGRAPAHEQDAKLLALWISGYHLGIVRDRSDAGLTAWLRRRFGIDVPRWPDFPAKARAVEGLKAWLARDAGVDWRPYVVRSCARGSESALGRDGREREIERPQARVLEAQWRILCEAGVFDVESLAALGAYACAHAQLGRADSHLALDKAQTQALMQDFGAKIRRAQIKRVPEPAA